jgi:hypothetical protein
MMQTGKYYIGDLCYVLSKEWEEFCDITISGDECKSGEFELKDGRKFATYLTAYGDGCYSVNIGGECGVDAGLIGCILVDDIHDAANLELENLGIIVEFDTAFETGESDGVICFGHVEIDTSDQFDDYNDYDDEY